MEEEAVPPPPPPPNKAKEEGSTQLRKEVSVYTNKDTIFIILEYLLFLFNVQLSERFLRSYFSGSIQYCFKSNRNIFS